MKKQSSFFLFLDLHVLTKTKLVDLTHSVISLAKLNLVKLTVWTIRMIFFYNILS